MIPNSNSGDTEEREAKRRFLAAIGASAAVFKRFVQESGLKALLIAIIDKGREEGTLNELQQLIKSKDINRTYDLLYDEEGNKRKIFESLIEKLHSILDSFKKENDDIAIKSAHEALHLVDTLIKDESKTGLETTNKGLYQAITYLGARKYGSDIMAKKQKEKILKTFLLGLIIAIVGGLMPTLYSAVKEYTSKRISFTYKLCDDYGAKILKQNYPYLCSFDTLKSIYLDSLKEYFEARRYTVKEVMRQDKVKAPIYKAFEIIKQIHEPSLNLIRNPYTVLFKLVNESKAPIEFDRLTITTEDAYQNALWIAEPSFTNDATFSMKFASSRINGFVISVDEGKVVLPVDGELEVLIRFPQKPIIRLKKSFAEIVYANDEKGSVELTERIAEDKEVKLTALWASIGIFTLFLVVLGLAYFFKGSKRP